MIVVETERVLTPPERFRTLRLQNPVTGEVQNVLPFMVALMLDAGWVKVPA